MEEKKLSVLDDCEHWVQICKVLGLTGEQLYWCQQTLVPRMEQGLKAMDLGANNNQRGTAAAMLGKMFKGQNKPKRIVAAVPTGKGKSRIIAALVSGMCLTGCARKIVVVFPSEILMKTDQEVLTKIAKLSQVKDAELECRVGLKDLKYDKHTFYIVDECDYELFEQQQMEAAR